MNIEWSGNRDELATVVAHIMRGTKRHPISLERLQKKTARSVESYTAGRVVTVLNELVNGGKAMKFGDGAKSEYYWVENLEYLKERLRQIIGLHHKNCPYLPGMKKSEIKRKFAESRNVSVQKNIDPRLFELALSACKNEGLVAETDQGVRLSDFVPQSREDEEIQELETNILRFVKRRYEFRISIDELSQQLGIKPAKTKTVLHNMVKAGRLVKIATNRYVESSMIEHLMDILRAEFEKKEQLQISEIKEVLSCSRGFVISFMEYLDYIGFTQRNGYYRKLSRPPSTTLKCHSSAVAMDISGQGDGHSHTIRELW